MTSSSCPLAPSRSTPRPLRLPRLPKTVSLGNSDWGKAAVGLLAVVVALSQPCFGLESRPVTSLDNPDVTFRRSSRPYVVLQRSGVRAVIVDNSAVDDDVLPGHRAGYSGVASLTRDGRDDNFFVPAYAGLNFEHIHDGTTQERKILFEPRNAPMELRIVDRHTCELYQPATPHWKLESCLRYQQLEDGALEMTLECIPRAKTFRHDYLGLFWASYIHQPESLDIHFRGRNASDPVAKVRWLRGVTPRHGVLSTHLGVTDERTFPRDADFPLSLVFNRSRRRFNDAYYYGVNRGLAFVQVFRPADAIRMTQSPSGGGRGNPAWDFQHFLQPCKVGRRYQMVMRAMLVPFESSEQIERVARPHRAALGHSLTATTDPQR